MAVKMVIATKSATATAVYISQLGTSKAFDSAPRVFGAGNVRFQTGDGSAGTGFMIRRGAVGAGGVGGDENVRAAK